MTNDKETPVTAKLVSHGVYQYVRLPKQFRFEGDEVEIEKYRNGVILKPLFEDGKSKQGKKTKS